MRLHGYYRSSTSYRVRIALNLKGLNYDIQPVDIARGEQKSDDFRRLNPHAGVPVLVTDDETVLAQSLAILDWLEEQNPEPSFWPESARERQICRELTYAIATEIHAPCNLPVLTYLETEFGADQEAKEAWNQRWMHKTLCGLERRLSREMTGDAALPFGRPTAFEVLLIPQLYNARRWKVDLAPFQALRAIDDHCQTLDAFKRAHPDEQPDSPDKGPAT